MMKKTVFHAILFGALIFVCCGFKLEKDPIALTQTEAKKAPTPEEQKKVKEVPVSPSFTTVGSMDKFMVKSPVSAERKTVPAKTVMPKAKSPVPAPGLSAKEVSKGKASEVMGELMMDDFEDDGKEDSGRATARKKLQPSKT